MRGRGVWCMNWAWAFLALLLAPSVAAGMTPLYAAFDGPQLQVAAPTQDSAAAGACVDGSGTGAASDSTWMLPFGAALVEYDFAGNGTPRFHPERGLVRDVHATAAVLHWSLAIPDAKQGLPFHLEAEVREGDDTADAQHLVAHGALEGTLQAGLQDFVLPLEIEGDGRIRKSEGFVLAVRLRDALDCAALESLRVRAVSQDAHRSRLELTTREGITIEFVHPEVAGRVMLVHTAFNTPFGRAALDLGNVSLTIDGPTIPQELQQVQREDDPARGLHTEPVEMTWVWKYRDEEAADGTYNANLTVWNLGHTDSATGNAKFVLEGGECYCVDEFTETNAPAAKGAPALPLTVLALVALLGTWLRRRRVSPS